MKNPYQPIPQIIDKRAGLISDAMQQTVSDWFETRTILLWVPILDIDDSITADDVQAAHEEFDGSWLIEDADDLLTLPDGIKGWLIALGDADTTVACGRWGSEITFMSIADSSTGAPITYRSPIGDNGMPLGPCACGSPALSD